MKVVTASSLERTSNDRDILTKPPSICTGFKLRRQLFLRHTSTVIRLITPSLILFTHVVGDSEDKAALHSCGYMETNVVVDMGNSRSAALVSEQAVSWVLPCFLES